MLGHEHLDLDFFIFPGRALLILEAENLLERTPPEDSPIRRDPNFNKKEFRIVWDTRKLAKLDSKESVIFIARKTQRFDTHVHVTDFLNAGHIVIAQEDCLLSLHSSASTSVESSWKNDLFSHPNLISVSSTEHAINLVVQTSSGLQGRDWTTLAITGTNGKTSTTQIASTMLEELSQKVVLRLGTLGIQVDGQTFENPFPTQPDFPGLLAALRMAHNNFSCRQVVMEATSIGIIEGRLGNWPVHCAAFLNLTQDHLDYHGTMEKYLDAKLDLFRRHLDSSGQVIVNCDDPHWEKVISASARKTRLCVGFGKTAQRDAFLSHAAPHFSDVCFLEASHQRTSVRGIAGQWTLWLNNHTSAAQCQYQVKLLGAVQHENVTASAAMMISLGYPLNQIAGVSQNIRAIPGRLELVETNETTRGPAVLVDYAHSPDALEKTLSTCRQLVDRGGQLICIFGCGGDRDPLKRPIMGRIASELADKIWVTSDNPRTEDANKILSDIVQGIKTELREKVQQQVDRKKAISEAIKAANENDVVLIAGKGHEDYQIVGTTKYPFSDSETARQALSIKRNI